MRDWSLTLGVAVALFTLGVLLGRAWILRRAGGVDGAQYGDHPHYLLGLNYLISNQPGLALVELSKAVRGETDAVEAYLALGNLFREKGQVERAIDIHKSLLHRRGLSDLGRTQALFSLALDFKSAGLIDRSERTLDEVVERDPENLSGWLCLRRVYEEMGRWEDAANTQARIDALAGAGDDRLLASLWAECGREARRAGDPEAAEKSYEKALALDAGYAPAHLGMGDCRADAGDLAAAASHWEAALSDGAAWGIEALQRISRAALAAGEYARIENACGRILDRQPHSWRAQLVLAEMHRHRGDLESARAALTTALTEKPGSMTVQRQLWQVLHELGADASNIGELFAQIGSQARLVDPFVCLDCGFKASKPFARCPHCHNWNTVADEQG